MSAIDPWHMAELVFLLVCSSLFSGLNLGIMSLDVTGLEVLMKVGEDHTKKYAAAILPIRQTGNWILCTLLLGNTLVNSIISILLADITSGIVGSFLATGFIVIFGEIMPQSICSRHGLAVGYYTRFFTYIAMFLMAPVAYPIAKFLDMIIKGEISHIYSRKELKEFITLHAATKGKGGELDSHEVEIMAGALEIGELRVDEVCTPIDKVNILNSSDVLDRKTITKVARDGHSRVPVCNDEGGIIGALLIKSLLLLDPSTTFGQQTIEQALQDPANQLVLVPPMFVDRREKLDDVLNRLVKDKKQLAFVVDNEAETPSGFVTSPSTSTHQLESVLLDKITVSAPPLPRSKSYFIKNKERNGRSLLIGVITMEDVMESIMHHEIDDEVDQLRKEKPSVYNVKFQSSTMVYTSTVPPELASPSFPLDDSSHNGKTPITPKGSSTWRKFQNILQRAKGKRSKKYGALEESKTFAVWQSNSTTPLMPPKKQRARGNSEPGPAPMDLENSQ